MALDPAEVHWHVRHGDELVRIDPDPDGLYRSAAFPGLWLDPSALLRADLEGLIAALERRPGDARSRGLRRPARRGCGEVGAKPGAHGMSTIEKVNLAEKLLMIGEHWSPKIVAELNGQQVKLVKFVGEFVWHHHDDEDELFLVVAGRFRMDFRDRSVWLEPGEFLVVPRGFEHRPVADEEAHVLLFEPAATLNTGNVRNERTVEAPRGSDGPTSREDGDHVGRAGSAGGPGDGGEPGHRGGDRGPAGGGRHGHRADLPEVGGRGRGRRGAGRRARGPGAGAEG